MPDAYGPAGIRAVRYEPSHRKGWDAFVDGSRNGTFLLKRGYVEYHADRFIDASLVIFDDSDRIMAVLPAARRGDVVTSHEGLTYGGLVTDGSMTLPRMLATLEAVFRQYSDSGVRRILYRPVPAPYHRSPCDEDLVAMFLLGATLSRRSALAVVDLRARLPFQERRRRGVKRAISANVRISASDDLSGYWQLLSSVLSETHDAQPVHTLQEMLRLQATFPDNIRLYGAFIDDRLIAGVLVYVSTQVTRAQYIASGPEGKAVGALDLLFHTLLNETFASKHFFDFGTSERAGAHAIQTGLLDQKEGFGARVIAQDQYEIDLTQWKAGRLLQALS